MKAKALRRILAVAAMLAVVSVFALESLPHPHVRDLDGRGCPVCQAARQHVPDSPRPAGVLLTPAVARTPQPADPPIERISAPASDPSTSPRSPPAVSS